MDIQNAPILKLLERLANAAEDSRLCDEFFQAVEPLTSVLCPKLGLTPQQAALYAIFVDNCADNMVSIKDIARYIDSRPLLVMCFQDDINALERRRFIRRSNRGMNNMPTYHVPIESIEALRQNKPYEPQTQRNLSFMRFHRVANQIIRNRLDRGTPYDIMVEELLDLVANNQQLKVARQLDELRGKLEMEDWLVLLTMCCNYVFDENIFAMRVVNDLLDDSDGFVYNNDFELGSTMLQRMGLVEFCCSNGMAEKTRASLTQKCIRTLLSEAPPQTDNDTTRLTSHRSIVSKPLFYDDELRSQVDRLSALLSPKGYKEVCNRLKKNHMRPGFSCLFYGAPGTGKTETVLQLARQTGRNIMQVDLSAVKDKYVGESEKNVKGIFDAYRELQRTEKQCPILLFNEADAIIGKRMQKVDHAVDSMMNTMQNILLQELETFEGILIATTNLEGNMDEAFDRRFLYKLRFERPTAGVRSRIWQSVIPELEDSTALRLAEQYDFSGGQIENIARKRLVDSILYGDAHDLSDYCRNETIQDRNARNQVGFNI